mmetsp:Transcript_37916/g.113437  ORF Transcript_37916/g.113437 Transcript_37916/m.113437 type:complete len:316 (+) Transcript_37916:844-1791(+)
MRMQMHLQARVSEPRPPAHCCALGAARPVRGGPIRRGAAAAPRRTPRRVRAALRGARSCDSARAAGRRSRAGVCAPGPAVGERGGVLGAGCDAEETLPRQRRPLRRPGGASQGAPDCWPARASCRLGRRGGAAAHSLGSLPCGGDSGARLLRRAAAHIPLCGLDACAGVRDGAGGEGGRETAHPRDVGGGVVAGEAPGSHGACLGGRLTRQAPRGVERHVRGKRGGRRRFEDRGGGAVGERRRRGGGGADARGWATPRPSASESGGCRTARELCGCGQRRRADDRCLGEVGPGVDRAMRNAGGPARVCVHCVVFN